MLKIMSGIKEQLTCRNGLSHYCPNCDNSIDAERILAEAQQLYLALVAMVATFEPQERMQGGKAALDLARAAITRAEA